MICSFSEGKKYPCGKCYACRQNKRRKWLARLLMESHCHPETPLFVTLTYAEEEVPKCLSPDGNEVRTLEPIHTQKWIKELRRLVVERLCGRTSEVPTHAKVRFYLCGEYGTKTGRPHYHAILYGPSGLILSENLLEKSWQRGFNTVRPADAVNMDYTLKYVLKDIGGSMELEGQHPTFARMSLRPPIGAGFAKNIGASLNAALHRDCRDQGLLARVEPVARIHGRVMPLDRTIRKQVRKALLAEGLPPHLQNQVYPGVEFDATPEEITKSREAHDKAWRLRKRQTINPV